MSFKAPPREKTVLDNPKLRLSADKLPNGESRPSLSLYWVGNNPRIDVRTQVPSEKDNGLIRATLDDLWLGVFLDSILKLCDPTAANDSAYIIECKNHTWVDKKRSPEPTVQSRLIAGKDKDGRIYVSVLSADPQRSKIRFNFGNTYYNALSFKGEKLSDAAISSLVAQSWVAQIRPLYALVAQQGYVHKTMDSKPANGGGGGGNYNNRGGSQSYQSQNSASDSDGYGDDLPF